MEGLIIYTSLRSVCWSENKSVRCVVNHLLLKLVYVMCILCIYTSCIVNLWWWRYLKEICYAFIPFN